MSHLMETITEALRLRDKMRADGMPADELARWFEGVIRQSWPHKRDWKYLCDTCRDYGLEMLHCPGDATCGRPKEHYPHEFGQACWCAAGKRHRKPEQTEGSDLAKVGQVKKPSRWGR